VETLLSPTFGKETQTHVFCEAVSFHTRQPFLFMSLLRQEGDLPDEATSLQQKTASAKNASQ
jgi:hypothetical protein